MMVEETLILETLGTSINIILSSLMIYVPLFKHKYKNDIIPCIATKNEVTFLWLSLETVFLFVWFISDWEFVRQERH